MEHDKVLYKVKPRFNFIYEIFIPSGRRLNSTFGAMLVFTIFYIIINVVLKMDVFKEQVGAVLKVDTFNLINGVYLAVMVVLTLKFLFHLIFQIWQYNSIRYTFYRDYLEYTDMFLNQQRKTIRYENIREIEIIKTIWDRINRYGTIIIYTNAEKVYENGLILYAIKNPQEVYAAIDEIVHNKKVQFAESKTIAPELEPDDLLVPDTELPSYKEEEFKKNIRND